VRNFFTKEMRIKPPPRITAFQIFWGEEEKMGYTKYILIE
jgi:hypothetical protein